MSDNVIPLFRPSVTDAEIRAVTDVLRSGWWAMGKRVQEFETRFAEYAGVQHAVATNSCTMALQIALEATGPPPGEVIVPALTFAGTALAALHAGYRVVFADVDNETLCLDWTTAAWSSETRAVIPVWYGGTVTEVPPTHGVPVIEDCAHAAGSVNAGRQALVACWSFQAVKNLATGDGGMITTDNAAIAEWARRMRWCGIDRSTWERESKSGYNWDYTIREAGHKAHMNDVTAALGLAQLERLDSMNKARRDLVMRYLGRLSPLSWARLPAWNPGSAWHLFYLRVPPGDRDRLISHLTGQGISAGVHYKPLNTCPVFGEHQPLPVTDRVWKTLVTLPLYPDMTMAEQDRVIGAVQAFRPGREGTA